MIRLPSNLGYSTGIPVCILVLKKCKKPDDVLSINAAEHFVKIIKTYQTREPEDRYARRVEMEEISLEATHGELVEIVKAIATAKHKHNDFLKALDISPLP